jgi:serine/threonine protein phosphatase PrpC
VPAHGCAAKAFFAQSPVRLYGDLPDLCNAALLSGSRQMNGRFFRFDTWAVSDKGCVRDINEDQYLVEPSLGLWVVADGMGGHDAGEVASTAIVEHLGTIGIASSAPDLRARFEDRLARANREIQKISMSRNGAVIGSTVAALVAYDQQFACIWSGDSRVYRVRNGEITQLSRDHTEVQELLDHGIITQQEALTWARRNVITKAVGVSPEIMIDIEQGQIEAGDIFLLCSDGLTAHVSSAEMLEALANNPPRDACERLLQLTLSRGGTDNVTVIVVHCRKASGTFIPGDSGNPKAERPN